MDTKAPQRNQIDVSIDLNKIIDDGNGTLTFKGGLVLSDESTHRNGRVYDIPSMDISQFDGTVFADHDYSVSSIVGKAQGITKRAKRLLAESVQFAVKESALARFTYEMVRGGFINAVSIGTQSSWDDMEEREDGTVLLKNAELVEFSFVGIGNNRNAKINEIATNTIHQAQSEGIETGQLKKFLQHNHVEVEEPKEEEETPMEPEKKPEVDTPTETTTDEPKEDQNKMADIVKNAISEAVKPLADKVAEIEKNAFDKNAQEPEFTPAANGAPVVTKNKFQTMNWTDRTQLQIESFFRGTKQADPDALKTLSELNKFHKEQLAKEGLIKNSITMGDFGNFVTSPELLTEIEGYRSDYSALLNVFSFRDTNSLRMSWLNRSGDINMQPVEMCDDGADGNLKPVSEYEATVESKDLEELAAVTPICTSATIFLAADLLGDAAAGYRNSYDKNLAIAVVAALELAAEDNDSASIAESGDLTSATNALAWIGNVRQAIFAISQGNGVLVMNEATFGLIWNALVIAGNGGALTDTTANGQTIQQLFAKRFVIVPNDLMPTLGDTATYKTFVVDGETVVINHAIFYVNPANFSGRQNGGLRYDLSTEAAYEVNGTVRSAYQRNEIVLRGSMFRAGVIRDASRVGAVRAGTVIS